jgi:hypothetical protein
LPKTLKDGQKYSLFNEFLFEKGKGISISDTMNTQHLYMAKAMKFFENLSVEATKMGEILMTWQGHACRT